MLNQPLCYLPLLCVSFILTFCFSFFVDSVTTAIERTFFSKGKGLVVGCTLLLFLSRHLTTVTCIKLLMALEASNNTNFGSIHQRHTFGLDAVVNYGAKWVSIGA